LRQQQNILEVKQAFSLFFEIADNNVCITENAGHGVPKEFCRKPTEFRLERASSQVNFICLIMPIEKPAMIFEIINNKIKN
jgi:hypothetical protein